MTNSDPIPGAVAPTAEHLARLRHHARHIELFPRRVARTTGGGHSSRRRGRGMEFEEVRVYQPGDDVRSIDWRVTARRSEPHTRVFREERERPVHLVVDLRQTMFFGGQRLKSTVACELAATLAWAGARAGDRIGGLVFGSATAHHVRTGRGQLGVLHLLRALSETAAQLIAPQPDRHHLEPMLAEARQVAHPGAALFLISDFCDLADQPGVERQLFELSRHCDITLLAVQDPLETALPPPGRYGVRTAAHRLLAIDSRDPDARRAFEQRANRRSAHLQALANRLNLGLIPVSTAEDPQLLLRRHFQRRHAPQRNQGSARRGRR
ncbi:MAG: DUF58 domain-containing protein [Porticoccaceae bacterium]